jgi:excisionase family DNA binding protein
VFPVPSTDTRRRKAQPPAYRRWLTQAEAAEHLGVTDRTIRNYIARGVLKGYRVHGSRLVRVDAQEVDAMLRPIPSAGGVPRAAS